MLNMLMKCPPEEYDILAIQEPYLDFLGNTRATPHWYPVYPRTHYNDKEKQTRSMILVNKRIATSGWVSIDIDMPDVTAISIKTKASAVVIFNLYIDCTHADSIHKVQASIQKEIQMNTA